MRHATGAICKRLAAPKAGLVRNRPRSILSDSLNVAFLPPAGTPVGATPPRSTYGCKSYLAPVRSKGAVRNWWQRLHGEQGSRWISVIAWSSVVVLWRWPEIRNKRTLHGRPQLDTLATMNLLGSRHGVALPISVGYT